MNLSKCCRGSIDVQNHLDGSRIYSESIDQTERLENWLDGSKRLSRRNPEISMDQESFKIYQEKEKEGLNRRESVKDRSRSCRVLKENVFQRREKHIEMNATSKLLKHRSNQHIKLSKHLSIDMQSIHNPKHTHTHTHNKSNQFYISKIS